MEVRNMAATKSHAELEPLAPAPIVGRDEMNLADFPIALLGDYAPNGQKTLYFEDGHGRLTVTGSDAYGLPTAADSDVIVALVYLTKLRNNFKDAKVNFSKYELINLLNWGDEGKSYKRLEKSLHRWSGVLLVFDKCWWNNKAKKYVTANMHILESVIFAEPAGRKRDGQSSLPLSTFTWNRTFIESCQADNLRQLDLDTYFSLQSAISKRLYRFLGKRFYLQGEWTFDLNEIAFDRVGLSRSYEDNAGKIKEKLQPAIDELEKIGFLRPLSRDDRYSRIDRGQWTIRLTRQSPTLVAPQQPALSAEPEPPPMVAALVQRGVTRATAADLAQRHPVETIQAKLEVFDWLAEKQDKRIARSPAGYLVKSIEKDYAAPKGFTSRAERQRLDETGQAKERQEAEARRRKQEEAAREKAERHAVRAYRKTLTADQLRDLSAKALASADEETRRSYESPGPREYNRMLLDSLTDGYILKNRLWELEEA
jgi:hypothetical protein